MSAQHPGFQQAAADIESKEHLPLNRAKAILAAGARKASKGAVKANPRLARVSGVMKPANNFQAKRTGTPNAFDAATED